MTAATANRNFQTVFNSDGLENQLLNKLNVLNDDVLYVGTIMAVDYTGEVQNATDTTGLRVQGLNLSKLDNADDGLTTEVKRGIFLLKNSTSSPITVGMVGEPCYVEDNQTVAGKTTAYVPAGLVHDVTTAGVWVDMRPQALASARKNGIKIMVAKTDNFSITSAQAFAGNVVFTGSKSGGMTFTLPSAVPGMAVGIQRLTASAGYDVYIQAATGDKVLGSAASKKVDNEVDGVSGILNIKAADATDWVASWFPADYASWVINNA